MERLFSCIFCIFLSLSIVNAQSGQATDLYEEAQLLYRDGRLSPAIDLLDQATALKQDYIEAYLLRAQVKEKMDDLEGAATDYTIVIHLAPELTQAWFQRGISYFQLERFNDALTDFHHILQNTAGETTTVYFKGKNEGSGFSSSGITTLQSDMQADVYNYLAITHLSLNLLDSAGFYIEAAIQKNPYEADFYVNRALLHEANCDTLEAIAGYQKALSLQSDHTTALINLNKISEGSEYHSLLSAAYDIAVNEQGTYQAYFNRAVNLQSQGKHRLAISDFDIALSLADQDDEVLLMRGYSKEKTADLKGALADYSNAIRLNPTQAKAYSNRANVYYKLKKYDLAVKDYNSAISFFPENPKLFYNRGLALYLSGNRTDACIDLHKSYDMGYVHAFAPLKTYCQ